jgi:hypothetical protein
LATLDRIAAYDNFILAWRTQREAHNAEAFGGARMMDLFKRRTDEEVEDVQEPEEAPENTSHVGFMRHFLRHKNDIDELESDDDDTAEDIIPEKKVRSFGLLSWFRRHQEEEVEETRKLVKYAAELHGVSAEDVAHVVTDEEDEDKAEEEEDEARGSSKHIGVWVTMVFVGAMFGFGIIFLMRFTGESDLAGPGAQAAIQAVQKSIAPTPGVDPSYSGTYISFKYPSTFNDVKMQAVTGIWAEEFTINSTTNFDREIAVSVENIASAQTDSGYMYRNMTPSLYTPEKTTVMNEPAVVMVKADNTERTLYWSHGGKLVVVSITDTNAGEDIASYMTLVTGTLRWIG